MKPGKLERPRRIWIVDDDPEDQVLLQDAFRGVDGEIALTGITTGDELMTRLKRKTSHEDSSPPDLLLLDLNLPGMHGREILQALKGSTSFRSIPVVVLTTSSREDDVELCYRLGANSYVRKPNSFSEI